MTTKQDAMEAAARAACEADGFAPDSGDQNGAVGGLNVDLYRHTSRAAVQAYLAAREAEGFVMVPVELLKRCRDRECNPFERDNQTKLHDDLCAALAARPTNGDS